MTERTYTIDQVRAAVAGEPRHLELWLDWLASNGFPGDSLTETHALAVAAGARFSEAKVPKAKITKLVKQLAKSPPAAGSDWVAVERPRVKEIAIEPGTFKGGTVKPNQRLPIVFDPYSVRQRLSEL